jgi:serine/threonine-protein kinase
MFPLKGIQAANPGRNSAMRLGYNTRTDASALLEPTARSRDGSDFTAFGQAQGIIGLGPGDVLDKRFLLAEVISQGGMATVFKAQDLQNQNHAVAVKVPHLGVESNPASFARFQREEEIGCRLDHPFILKFVHMNGDKSRPYIVTEYLRGCTLGHLLSRIRPLPEKDALKFASLICEALRYLHEHGVVHRDLKPSNVMLCPDGTIRIMDFGISRMVDTRRMTFVGFTAAMGTPDYIAPEQIKGRRGDQRSDIYSLGAMLYELLTGSTPFDGDDPFVIMNTRMSGDPAAPRTLNPQLSREAEEIVLRALQRDPARRYPTAAAMKADLDTPERARVTGLCDSLQESTRWRRFLLLARWIAVMCILPLVIQVLLFLLLWHHPIGKR